MTTSWLDAADAVATPAVEDLLRRKLTSEERQIVVTAIEVLVDHTILVVVPSYSEVY